MIFIVIKKIISNPIFLARSFLIFGRSRILKQDKYDIYKSCMDTWSESTTTKICSSIFGRHYISLTPFGIKIWTHQPRATFLQVASMRCSNFVLIRFKYIKQRENYFGGSLLTRHTNNTNICIKSCTKYLISANQNMCSTLITYMHALWENTIYVR